jgi:hypothetical protein
MTSANPDIARAYVDGVRELLSPSGAASAERGAGAPTSYAGLAERAETLAPLSAELTRSMSEDLAAPDVATRTDAASRLLAKALADLEVTAYLAQAATDEADGVAAPAPVPAERGMSASGLDDTFALILGELSRDAGLAVRGEAVPPNVPAARVQLATGVDDTMQLITERAARAGQTAVTGLLTIGVAELASAVAVVGTDLATAVGQGEAASKLIHSVAGFASQAGNSLTALLGPTLAQSAAKQVLSWVDEVRSGNKFAEILDRLYDTPATVTEIQRLTGAAPDDLARFIAAIGEIDSLDEAYAQQVALAEKILAKVRFLALIPIGALPQGRLLMAAVYLVLAGYIVLCGADYVDSPRLALLKRVPGVREVVKTHLGAPA